MVRPKPTTASTPHQNTPTLILDNGAFTMKAGFAQSTTPADPSNDCHLIPNCIGRARDKRIWIGGQLHNCKDFGEMAFRRPVEKGYLVNWEAEKEIWEKTFFDKDAKLKCDPHETNLILTEAPNAPQALQANCDQMVFEDFGFASCVRCLGSIKGPSLNAYNDTQAFYGAPPRPAVDATTTSAPVIPAEALLLIDSGFSHTTVTPLVHGRPIQPGMRRLDIGGKFLTNYLKELVSIRHYNMMDETHLMSEIKEAVCYVTDDFAADLERTWKGGLGDDDRRRQRRAEDHRNDDIVVDYVLPDYSSHRQGYVRPSDPARAARMRKLGPGGAAAAAAVGAEAMEDFMTLGNERFTVPELLFYPSDVGMKQAGLPEMIMRCLDALPAGLWPAMLANVVLVGGNAKMPGFLGRLESELRRLAPSEYTVRVACPPDPIKSTWLGGVHLASNKALLSQVLVTRQEYQEHGSHWVAKRFAGGGIVSK
ncbi:MAG: Actin- protein 6 [Peltula sp. TS41687]|nr:MAG: Actin- protein 6 [Peltula sp. TS41687]